MKVLLINTFDKGGAAKACIRLHQGLLKNNINSKILLKNKTNLQIPETFKIPLSSQNNSLSKKINNELVRILKGLKLYPNKPDTKEQFIRQRVAGLEMFSFPESDIDITKSMLYKEADILNLHWVSNFLDYQSFFRKTTIPVVWTLHDMNPFTGGEHYTEKYLGIDEKGYPISREINKNELNVFNEVINIKKEALSYFHNLHIVAVSKWLFNEAKKSTLFRNYPIHLIPYGIDSAIFQPRNREFSRELLNIPQNKTVILFVSDSIQNERKGYKYLLKAFEKIRKENIILLSIGYKNKVLSNNENLIELGNIQDERFMSIIYSAADVFVIPSLMDNLPNTLLESIMCGTPVIGFPVGGILDVVQNEKNGYICPEISVLALTDTLKKFLDKPDIFSTNVIRKEAVKKYDLSIQANAYIKLYKFIIK